MEGGLPQRIAIYPLDKSKYEVIDHLYLTKLKCRIVNKNLSATTFAYCSSH